MKVIFKRNFSRYFGYIPLLAVTLISILFPFITKLSLDNTMQMGYEAYLGRMISHFVTYTFIFVFGVVSAITVNNGADTIANETHENTLRLLVAKPISRMHIIFAKVLSVLVSCFIYLVYSLLIAISVHIIINHVDSDIILILYKMTFALIVYGVILSFIFTSISVFLSTIFKRKAPIVLFMILIVGLVFIGWPIIRLVVGEKYNIYFTLFDLNFHFASMLDYILSLFNVNIVADEFLALFIGIFKTVNYDSDFLSNTYNMIIKNETIPQYLILLTYLLISISFMVLSFKKFISKDI